MQEFDLKGRILKYWGENRDILRRVAARLGVAFRVRLGYHHTSASFLAHCTHV